ncbi:hypothetical protein Zmor_024596 [Zophobas morio]|uniref:Uncharacterized protein n=1 Tax=Zophobas morio TaxID=2755281 RepID=A0AA38M856_9CUCU|nr:hypothetical protein Zmor_024596 [Zophobas morio]
MALFTCLTRPTMRTFFAVRGGTRERLVRIDHPSHMGMEMSAPFIDSGERRKKREITGVTSGLTQGAWRAPFGRVYVGGGEEKLKMGEDGGAAMKMRKL